MKRNVSVVRLIVATRSSGPPASGKIIKEMPSLVASGSPYIQTKVRSVTVIKCAIVAVVTNYSNCGALGCQDSTLDTISMGVVFRLC
jgi:hypothetical protein